MIRPVASRVELGVKTKTQLVAEKAVLTSLLTAVISAAGDEVLAEQAVPFCRSICRCGWVWVWGVWEGEGGRKQCNPRRGGTASRHSTGVQDGDGSGDRM